MTTRVPVMIDGSRMLVEVSADQSGETEVSTLELDFEEFLATVESFGAGLMSTLKKLSPDKASAEFSVEVAVESGALTTLLVKGSGKGNVKITLEWSKQ